MDGAAELGARVERLERELARWRGAGLGAAFLVAAALGLAALRQESAEPAHAGDETVRARRIEVVGAGGAPAVVLDADDQGFGRITLLGASERPTVVLHRDDAQNGGVTLHNAAGALVAYLGADREGNGGLRIENVDGERIFYAGDDLRGNGVIEASAKPGSRLR